MCPSFQTILQCLFFLSLHLHSPICILYYTPLQRTHSLNRIVVVVAGFFSHSFYTWVVRLSRSLHVTFNSSNLLRKMFSFYRSISTFIWRDFMSMHPVPLHIFENSVSSLQYGFNAGETNKKKPTANKIRVRIYTAHFWNITK